MNYTQSDSFSTHAGTGHHMHDDAKAVPTAWSGKDANSVIWSLMQLLVDAGVSPASFDADDPATYNRVSQAVQILGGVRLSQFTGANQSLAAPGYQKLPGGLIVQWGTVGIGSGPSTINQAFSFPIAFTSAVFSITGNGDQGANGGWMPFVVMFNSVTLTGANAMCDTANPGQGFAAGRSVRWCAVGM